VDVEQDQVVQGEPQEKHPSENVAPNVDRLVGPPKYAAKSIHKICVRREFRNQQRPKRLANSEAKALAQKREIQTHMAARVQRVEIVFVTGPQN